jgi:effector-binding domain-containing protein
MEITLIVIFLVLTAWTIWGFFSSRVEQTEYSVISRANGYEIREYPAHLVAQTTVAGSYEDALQQGFRIVAGYIFGGNTKKENISMTAPVVEQRSRGQTIAMTAPVTANIEGESHTIAFGMPRSYTLAALPKPNDPRVKLVEIPRRKMAVKRFSMWRTEARVQSKKQELLSALSRDRMTVVGEPQYAGYNAPWTPPWMMRNEVLVEIE